MPMRMLNGFEFLGHTTYLTSRDTRAMAIFYYRHAHLSIVCEALIMETHWLTGVAKLAFTCILRHALLESRILFWLSPHVL